MMNDLLFPKEQDERLNAATGNRERVSDELMAQMLFQFELYYPPVFIKRSRAIMNTLILLSNELPEFRPSDEQTLTQKFKPLRRDIGF